MARATGQAVTIAGPIEVALLPRPTLIARDVTVMGESDGAIGLELTAKQADMGLRLGPLLAGRPIVDDLKLNRPIMTIGRTASRQLRSWPPRWDDWVQPVLGLELKEIGITDGRLELAGDGIDSGLTLSGLTVKLITPGPNGPLEAVGLFKAGHHRFSFSAGMGELASDGAGTLKMTIDAQNGIEETTTLDFSGILDRRGDEQGVRGTLNLRGPDLQNGLQAISAATGYPSTFRSLAPAQPFTIQGHVDANRSGILADEVKLALGEKLGGGRIGVQFHPRIRLDLDLELPTLRLADTTPLSDFVPLDLLSAFPHLPGEIDIRLREMVYRRDAVRQARLKVRTGQDRVSHIEQAKALLPGLVDVQFDGTLRPSNTGRGLSGRLAAVGDDLGRTLDWLDLVAADRGQGWRGFSLEGDLDVTSVEIALSGIDMRLDSSKIQGMASLRFSERLRLDMDVDVDRLNLDLYPIGMNTADLTEALAEQLNHVDASVDARFQRLAWNEARFEEAVISASAEDGRLDLRSLAARTVGETAVTLEGKIDLQSKDVDLAGDLSSRFPIRALRHIDVDLPPTSARLKPLQVTGWVKGQLNAFDMAAQANYDGGDWSIEGRAGWIDKTAHYDLAIEADHPNHQELADHLGLAPLLPADDASGPFQVTGRMRHDPKESWSATGSAKLGPTTITGSLVRQKATQRDTWEAKLSIGNPKQDSLAPFLTLAGFRLAGGWTPETWLGRLPRVAFRTGWLDNVDGSLSLMSKGGLAGKGFDLSARLDQGFLYVDQLKAKLWQGELLAEMSLERRRDQPYAAIALELDHVDAAALADWLDMPEVIDGPLDLRMEATSVGQTPYNIVAAMSGEIEVEVVSGNLQGADIKAFKPALLGETGGSQDPGLTDLPLTMPLVSLLAEADLSRGIATIKDASLIVEPRPGAEVRAAVTGTVDLLLWIAELTMIAETKGPDEGAAPFTYRMVGSPDRPVGTLSSGR